MAQVGEGADELFWGYPARGSAPALQRRTPPRARVGEAAGLSGLRLLRDGGAAVLRVAPSGNGGSPRLLGRHRRFVYDTLTRRLLSERLRARFAKTSSWDALAPIWRRFQDGAWERSPLNWMSYLDLNLRLPELLLMRVDKMSMAASVECRVPFLDHRFVELAMSIPQSMKTEGRGLKHILKDAVRGLIPDAPIDRKKQGFHVPVSEWLLERLGGPPAKMLDEFTRETDLLDRKEVGRLFDRRFRDEDLVSLQLRPLVEGVHRRDSCRCPRSCPRRLPESDPMPLVSVIITTRNRASLLAGAIESVLAQPYPRLRTHRRR